MRTEKIQPPYFGLMAEFKEEEDFIQATRKTRDEGYRKMDAYSPYPIEEIIDILHLHHNKLPLIVLIGGIMGGIGCYFMEYFASVIHYPLNIGGRPLHSWPSFLPPAFEITILCAAIGAVVGMLALNGLPMPYHPVFNVPEFEKASNDGFFLCVESHDPKFDLEKTHQFLESLKPVKVSRVEH